MNGDQPEPNTLTPPVTSGASPALAQHSTLHSPPPSIPDHELLRCIGRGSYGEVWLARNVLGDFRAVKVVYRKNFEHDRPYDREFEGIQKFEPISRQHDSQVDILHVGRNDEAGYFYYVMELADAAERSDGVMEFWCGGGKTSTQHSTSPALQYPASYTPHTLKLDLYCRDRLPVDECIKIGLALTTALEYLHSHGLVHRDIKPSNIIFVGGRPKLADIGLVTSMDKTMSFVGTSGFLPPEGPGTPQADLYSLGKVLYEMSMGRDRTEFPKLPPELIQESTRASRVESGAGQTFPTPGHEPERQPPARRVAAAILENAAPEAGAPMREGARRPNAESQPNEVFGETLTATSGEPQRLLELNAVILKACHHDPRQRYQSAQEMAADLFLLQRGQSVKRRRAAALRWKRMKKAAVAASLLGLLFTALVSTRLGRLKSLDPLTTGKNVGGYPPTTMRGTRNLEAWNHYKLGYFAKFRAPADRTVSPEHEFREAIRLDPNFALAYFELFIDRFGDTWLKTHAKSPDEFRGLAAKIVELDPELAETHVVLGLIKFWEWNWADAEREYRQALHLNPDCMSAHVCYGLYLSNMGRSRESLDVLESGQQVDPTHPNVVKMMGHAYFVDRDFTNALTYYQKAIRIEPEFPNGHFWASRVCFALGDYATAIDELEIDEVKSEKVDPVKTEQKYREQRDAFKNSGEEGYWRKRLEQATATMDPDDEPYAFARIYAHLGDTAQTFKYLEKAYTRHDELIYLIIDERWDRWREHPRFKSLMNKVGLAEFEREWLRRLAARKGVPYLDTATLFR